MADGFWVHLDSVLTRLMVQATTGISDQLSTSVLTMTSVGVTCVVTYYGYLTLAGKMDKPVEDTVMHLALMGIIVSILSNYGGMMSMIQDGITGLKEGIGTGENIWGKLDGLWLKTQQVADKLYQMDSDYFPLKGALGMTAVWVGSLCVMIITSLVTLVAQITLQILSVIAPLFIYCLAWGWFRTMFTKFLETITSTFLTIILIGVFATAATYVINGVLTDSVANPDSNILTSAFGVLAAGALCGILTFLAPKIAGVLAGASIAQAVGSAASRGLSTAATAGADQVKGAVEGSQKSLEANKQGWADAASGKGTGAGGAVGYRAAQARDYAKNFMQERAAQLSEQRAVSNSSNVVRGRFGS
ncbi:type IV secretion system protein [Pantoea ananatis]|uniref:type IV secretion system protein n=1 Tax=Pantoea ananas TaxID=553 RepID=UPI001B30D754|nr:type IV secretion system protein [Pantoea ananatis]